MWLWMWSAWLQKQCESTHVVTPTEHAGVKQWSNASLLFSLLILKYKICECVHIQYMTWLSTHSPPGTPSIHRKVGTSKRPKRAYLAYLKTRFHLCKCTNRVVSVCCDLEWTLLHVFLSFLTGFLQHSSFNWKRSRVSLQCCLQRIWSLR